MEFVGSNVYQTLMRLVSVLACFSNAYLISLPDIQGWQENTLHILMDQRLEFRQRPQHQQPSDGLWVTLSVPNLQQCLRLCWLYSSCGVVSYSIPTTGPKSCRLFARCSYRSVTKVSDSNAVVVNMTRAIMKKRKLFGCDRRPCQRNEMCITVTSQDNYKCLPLVSIICGQPSNQIDNAVLTTDGLGHAFYRCKDGYVPTPETGVTTKCDTRTGRWPSVSLSCRYVDCDVPPELQGATVRYTETSFGSLATYSCQAGHYSRSEPNMNVQCMSSGRWSDMPHPCKLVDCGQPNPIENGQVELQDVDAAVAVQTILAAVDKWTLYGGLATHSCLEGYKSRAGNVKSTCQNTGFWSELPDSFECQPVDCGSPPTFDFASKEVTSTTYPSNVSYTCLRGYEAVMAPGENIANLTSQCQADGSWTTINITCLPINCGIPGDFPGFDVTFNSTTAGSIAYVKCSNTSHLFKGSDQLACNVSGRWSEINATCSAPPCSQPQSLDNATVAVKTTHDDKYIAIFQSVAGFLLNTGNHSAYRTCVRGSWEGYPDLKSVPVSCDSPPPILNADVSAPATTYQSKAVYSCRTGFQNTTHSNRITCLENGKWSQGMFGCTKISCGNPPLVEHSKNNISLTYSYGDQLLYQCEDGFTLKTSNDRITCTETGWESTQIECVRAQCGPPPFVFNSTYVINGEDVIYSCDEGLALIDGNVSKKTCESDVWSGEDVVCVLDKCPEPTIVENAIAKFNSTSRASIVTYECVDGFRLAVDAINQRQCKENGEWSTENVVCHPIECGPPPTISNTDMSDYNRSIGSIVSFRCKVGYTVYALVGTFADPVLGYTGSVGTGEADILWKATCNSSGHWSSNYEKPERCSPVDCGNPPIVEQSNFTKPSNTLFGSVVVYSCVYGFRLTSELNTKTCGELGIWLGNVECTIIDCPEVEPIGTNTLLELEGKRPGDTAVFACQVGYVHWWFDRKTCQENGTWSTPRIQCHIIDCGQPPIVEHAKLTFDKTTYGSYANYRCQSPYVNSHQTKRKRCNAFGWGSRNLQCKHKNELSCSVTINLIEKSRGIIYYTNVTEGGLAVYQCYEGYHLEVSSPGLEEYTRTCRAGVWTGQNNACMANECGSHPNIQYATAAVSKTTYKSEVLYRCHAGYRMAGPESKSCMADGNWSDDAVECIQSNSIYCPPPVKSTQWMIRYKSHTVGSKAIYTCIEGYVEMTKEIECLATGHWSSLGDFKCVRVNCHRPPDMKNTEIHFHETLFEHYAIYTCSFYRQDDEHRPSRSQCQANGTWTSVRSPCYHCRRPPHLPNAVTQNADTITLHSIGDIVTYNCSEGYVPFPNDQLVQMRCAENGDWSEGEIKSYCIPEICKNISLLDPKYVMHVVSVDVDLSQITARYSCSEGYYLEGYSDIDQLPAVCSFEFGWNTGLMFPCLVVDCGPHEDIPNAVTTVDTTTYLSEITFTCKAMYLSSGSVMTSVCGRNGTWSPVNLTCVQCAGDVFIPNGRLVEIPSAIGRARNGIPTDASQSQEAIVECDGGFLLYSDNGRVSPTVNCVLGSDGSPRWKSLDSLECVQNTWVNPNSSEPVRFDQSYAEYRICLDGPIPDTHSISVTLLPPINENGTTVAMAHFSIMLTKQRSRIDLIQVGSDTKRYLQTVDMYFEDKTTHRLCIVVVTDQMLYQAWLDDEYIGELNEINDPVSSIGADTVGREIPSIQHEYHCLDQLFSDKLNSILLILIHESLSPLVHPVVRELPSVKHEYNCLDKLFSDKTELETFDFIP